ncbi:Propanediol utilization protein [Syntrophobotulus glycolicus DSM 8271]|uniref:Phosphate propanoyltransferase n=1 Tax=Syntrophobotulus glycolicus (strain DSM 8271 / FlGlyR) TaxID=645991 RepID=F0T022_SYNGF|nr:phosphate propanoyltransferase [Syntrophobotulus glycolicus]ADY55033.1 Propanediol utilization protein [Syntrophobotulus glycolicus DSM 8271]
MKTFHVSVGVSNHHVHLTAKDIEALFGAGYQLAVKKELSQPGEFAAEETVTLVGPRGQVPGVRILGPARKNTQVEITMADNIKLGITAPVRDSGNLEGSGSVVIEANDQRISLKEGVIVAARHLHASTRDAAEYGLRDRDVVQAKIDGPRGGILENILVRVSPTYSLDLHLDIEEANAMGLKNGDKVTILAD